MNSRNEDFLRYAEKKGRVDEEMLDRAVTKGFIRSQREQLDFSKIKRLALAYAAAVVLCVFVTYHLPSKAEFGVDIAADLLPAVERVLTEINEYKFF